MNVKGRLRSEALCIGSPEAGSLLEEIRVQKWSGYLKIEFSHYKFVLLLEDGVPTHGFRVIDDQLFSFSSLLDTLPSLQDARLSFYELSPAGLQALLDTKFGYELYGSLHTTFCDLRRLFLTLQRDRLTGSVEVDVPSLHCFILWEEGNPGEVVCEEGKEPTLECVLEKAAQEDGTIRVFKRRGPLTVPSPDPEEVFSWSRPHTLKLEFAFGQLGKEFENLLDKKLTVSQILDALHVDFVEIVEMYTYLSAKGYIATDKMVRK